MSLFLGIARQPFLNFLIILKINHLGWQHGSVDKGPCHQAHHSLSLVSRTCVVEEDD